MVEKWDGWVWKPSCDSMVNERGVGEGGRGATL